MRRTSGIILPDTVVFVGLWLVPGNCLLLVCGSRCLGAVSEEAAAIPPVVHYVSVTDKPVAVNFYSGGEGK